MRARGRVQAALRHEVADRCPMQISFTPEFAVRLRQELHQSGGPIHNPHGGGNTYELERALGEDLLLTSVGWANSYYANDQYAGGASSYTDEWGVAWRNIEYQTRFGTGFYTEMCGHPLAEDSSVDGYQPPDPSRPELYREAEKLLDRFKKEYWIVGVTVCTVFETAWALRGYEKLLMDFSLNPELAERILEIPFRYHLSAAQKLVELGVDMIWVGDDVGTQHSMLISPATWRRFLKPRLRCFIQTLKSRRPDLKVAYHSDGCIDPIIPDLIEVGVDVLNPVQPASMDPEKLKKEYGKSLCFWGTLDEQHTLPFGTPEDVRAEVQSRKKNVGNQGGLILGPTHHVQLDTPMENFWAMVNAITDASA